VEGCLYEPVHTFPALDPGSHRGDAGLPDLPDPDHGSSAVYLLPVLNNRDDAEEQIPDVRLSVPVVDCFHRPVLRVSQDCVLSPSPHLQFFKCNILYYCLMHSLISSFGYNGFFCAKGLIFEVHGIIDLSHFHCRQAAL